MKKEKLTEAVNSLANSLTREDLINYVTSKSYRYTEEKAAQFLDWLENDYCNGTYFQRFKLYVMLIESEALYSWDLKHLPEDYMRTFMQEEQEKAYQRAIDYGRKIEQNRFKNTLIDFYKGKLTRAEVEDIFNPHHINSVYNDWKKTISKIENKLQTKTHSLEKIIKLIDEDIERGYAHHVSLTEEECKEWARIRANDGFKD